MVFLEMLRYIRGKTEDYEQENFTGRDARIRQPAFRYGLQAVNADPENKSLHRSLTGTAALFRYACRPVPLNLNINN